MNSSKFNHNLFNPFAIFCKPIYKLVPFLSFNDINHANQNILIKKKHQENRKAILLTQVRAKLSPDPDQQALYIVTKFLKIK